MNIRAVAVGYGGSHFYIAAADAGDGAVGRGELALDLGNFFLYHKVSLLCIHGKSSIRSSILSQKQI